MKLDEYNFGAKIQRFFFILQVLAPNDVQFSLPLNNLENEAEEVVISYDAQDNSSLCVDTSAFVGVTVAFIMILVVALITIIFLWLRIKSLDTSKRCFWIKSRTNQAQNSSCDPNKRRLKKSLKLWTNQEKMIEKKCFSEWF